MVATCMMAAEDMPRPRLSRSPVGQCWGSFANCHVTACGPWLDCSSRSSALCTVLGVLIIKRLTIFRVNDKLIKEAQVVWIKYTRSRAERYTHDT
jgi:hypothetical protein